MAKDVVTFLSWAAEPEADERKKMGFQALIILSSLTALSLWVKKFKWGNIKTRKLGMLLFTFSLMHFLMSGISLFPS
jgi:ubiquinol-cytochrome c reductase cytochrome c1 subunit